jgi:hypothetical protein
MNKVFRLDSGNWAFVGGHEDDIKLEFLSLDDCVDWLRRVNNNLRQHFRWTCDDPTDRLTVHLALGRMEEDRRILRNKRARVRREAKRLNLSVRCPRFTDKVEFVHFSVSLDGREEFYWTCEEMMTILERIEMKAIREGTKPSPLNFGKFLMPL